MDSKQKQDEDHFRQVERALLYADDAARKIGKIAEQLRRDGCDPGLVAALERGSEAVRAEHRQMMKSVYFRAPESPQGDLLTAEQPERLAS
jgi:hypothetical protein